MQDIKISLEMRSMLKDPATKAAWLSEHESPNPSVCSNCGGIGFLYMFIGSAGPFTNVPGIGVAHFHDGKWWKGETFSFACPVCVDDNGARVYKPHELDNPRLPYSEGD